MRRFLKLALGCAVFASFAMPAISAPSKINNAASEKIFVEKVEGLSDDFMKGVDISALSDIEKNGGKYYDETGKEADLFEILKNNGVNWIRLRVWNNPTVNGKPYGGGNNSVDVDIPMAVRAKKAGFKLLIDFHYSDTWADPGKQNMPQDWANLNEKQLNAAVEKFTNESLKKFIDAGARPDAVQIGNELNGGFMWPIGKTWAADGEKIGGFKAFTTLLKSAAKGVRTVDGGDKMKIIIHLADGGDNGLYRHVFDQIKKAGVDYDIIGLSFYTYWHGSMNALKANLEDISKRYGKEVAVVETAYGYTEEDADDQGNVFMIYSDENHGYTASVQGQATAIRDIIETVASVKGGVGVFYWEPAWIPVKGAGLSATEGNTWDNQAMFDAKGRVLPSMAVWKLVSGAETVTNVWGGSASNGKDFKPYAIADKIEVTAKPGETPVLPEKIKVLYENDSESLVNVKWENRNWATEKLGKYEIKGAIENSTFVPTATVTITDRANLIADPSFESGKMGNWKLNGSGTACFMENNKGNAHTGKFTYKYWLGSGFQSALTQTFDGIPNGNYDLSVWAMGGGGENEIRLFASDFDGSGKQVSAKIVNTGWQEWKQYKVTVPVTNGKATVGIYLDTKPDCWGNFDDIEFIKADDGAAVAKGEGDDFVVDLKKDYSKAISAAAAAPATTGNTSIQQGVWIEVTSDNTSLIRNVSDGEKSGYEFDNSHLQGKMNWWFWGNIGKSCQLDAEVAVFKFDKTLYQENTYADNVPDVTWGDGFQSLFTMPFSFFNETNDEGVGMFNKLAFNVTSPWVIARFGYGNLKKNGMSEFTGIYTVLDRWLDVGKGYTELKNGTAWQQFGDFKIDFLAAFSEMRDSYGLYDVIDLKYAEKAEVAFTFGSTTTEKQLFYYNKNYKNAISAYAAYSPIDMLKLEAHGLGYFGSDHDFSTETSAVAGRVTLTGKTWEVAVSQSAAGKNANSVWGSDGTEYDDINADTLTSQINVDKSFSTDALDFAVGLDQGITVENADDFSAGKMNFRTQPYADFEFKNMKIGAYGVLGIDRVSKETSEDREVALFFDEAGIEFETSELAKNLKKLTFDYAVKLNYEDWKNGSSYPLKMLYHSIMANATLTDRIDAHIASIIRTPAETDNKNVPFAFSVGASFKKIRFPGRPMLWVHFTYGMNPYEDNNYTLFRKDHENNKPTYRTYLLNTLDKEITKSHISFGLIWDIK